jgi:magnesium and cobalt transporter
VSDFLGRVPRRGEQVTIGNFRFQVQRADARQLHMLLVEKIPPSDEDQD